MQNEGSMVVDRGQYQDAMTPWEQVAWRDAALGWAEHELTARGLRETGRRRVRLRPWSVLVRLGVVGHGAVWFKANPPAGAFEAALISALSHWVPEHVLEPLAVDVDHGWSLLPDGGDLFRDVLNRGPADPRAWEEPLRQYASMQQALIPHAEEIELLGVPSARTTALPDIFDQVIAENTALQPDDLTRLHELRPRLVDWCMELADVGVADTLDHSDLHDGQLFNPEAGRFTFFDWGDAAVSHPFCSFLVPARTAGERYGPEALPRLRDAYVEPWTGNGRTAAELRRAVTLAGRLGAIGRACSWGRLFPGASDTADATGAEESAKWLLELCTEPSF
ncbi:aminoglycoside phosphotransferase family protein [Streptomyces sp. NBC_00654]|uniref:phosphotransferase n=1 Tax=Streptomyces sp. NBC_00654 TaxID=2975799 RepID=UPI00224F4EEB|nr:phosphotransferase [Streptomyces sp. NBC_00654]MCX4967463.1 aminoglycoside phosphotransferase family protein [Streptomyces sp. NBC_00654]